jgi:hypothetical protein
MKTMAFLKVLVVFSILGLLLSSNIYAKEPEKLRFYWHSNIEYFGKIEIHLRGDAEKLFNKDEVANYVYLKYGNNFKGILPFKKISHDKLVKHMGASPPEQRTVAHKIGHMAFKIWLVGDDYPIAYNIKFHAGSVVDKDLWNDEVLGYGSKDNLSQNIRKTIDRMLEGLASKVLAARKKPEKM